MPSTSKDDSTHVYALAEHVELRQDGWWEEALKRTAQFVLFTRPSGTKSSELIRLTELQLASTADRHLIWDSIQSMLASNSIREERSLLFLTEATRREYEAVKSAADSLEKEVCERYYSIVHNHESSIDDLPDWDGFCNTLLRPLIRELGAETLDLVRGQTKLLRTHAQDVFLKQFKAEHKILAEQLVVDFLDPSNAAVRRYVLGHLNHYMLVSSSSMDKRTLDALRRNGENRPVFHVVLDTNVIFSILNLHFNPSNAAAKAFLDLSRTIKPYADVYLHVLAPTLVEARDAIRAAKDLAPSGSVTGYMAEAAHSTGQVSGLVRRYFEVAAERGGLSPASYFEPYIDGMDVILEELGVDLVSEGLDGIGDRKSFKDAVADWYSHESGKTNGRSKSKIVHDLLALEFVRDHRKRNPTTLADAEWWLMTADFRLQAYERRSLAGNRMFPKSINPAELIQMMRFWAPRSDYMDSALVGAIRLPFSFYQFDDRMEKTSLKILERMSRYSNNEEIPTRVIERLFTDKALRMSMEDNSSTVEERDAAITIAVNRAAQELEKDLERKEQQVIELTARLESERQFIQERNANQVGAKQAAINQGIEVSKTKRLEELNQITRQLEKERAANRKLVESLKKEKVTNQDREKSLDEKLIVIAQSAREGRNADRVMLIWLVTTTALVWATFEFIRSTPMSGWTTAVVWAAVSQLSLGVGLALSKLAKLNSNSRIVRLFGKSGRTLATFIGSGVVSAVIAFALVAPPSP